MTEEEQLGVYREKRYAVYERQRAEVDKFALEMGGRYERMLSLVAGGALAVSLTFIEKIAPSPVRFSSWIMLAAWLLLGAAIVACLYAISQSQNAVQKRMENLDSEVLKGMYPEDERYRSLDTTSNPYTDRVRAANRISLWATVLGLACLVIFAFVNFPSSKSNERQRFCKPAEDSCTEP